ncbi:hypothetical protein BDR05DRAFT_960132 [Suillus weaverae]|nr:hypothetical protein BDR05DRAFT_960132 [Suillus weaverae]
MTAANELDISLVRGIVLMYNAYRILHAEISLSLLPCTTQYYWAYIEELLICMSTSDRGWELMVRYVQELDSRKLLRLAEVVGLPDAFIKITKFRSHNGGDPMTDSF